jgi:hypothetical protein
MTPATPSKPPEARKTGDNNTPLLPISPHWASDTPSLQMAENPPTRNHPKKSPQNLVFDSKQNPP